MKLIVRLLITAIGLLIVSYSVPGIMVESFQVALIAAVLLGLLNLTIRPILRILTLPITFLTFGLSVFVINAGLFLLAASFIQGFSVENLLSALIGSVIVSIISIIGNSLIS